MNRQIRAVRWLAALALAACGHAQQPPPPASLSASELGTLHTVPLTPSHESNPGLEASQRSMALGPERGKQEPDPVATPPGEAPLARSESRAELQLRERIQRALGNHGSLSYTAQRVSVAVDNHTVTLAGDVRTEREKADVQAIVQRVQGVRRVENRLAVIDQPQPAAR